MPMGSCAVLELNTWRAKNSPRRLHSQTFSGAGFLMSMSRLTVNLMVVSSLETPRGTLHHTTLPSGFEKESEVSSFSEII